jgi:hypothetical protein
VLCEEIVAEGVTEFDAFVGLLFFAQKNCESNRFAQPFQTKNTVQLGRV